MKLLKFLFYISILVFTALIFFENDVFFMEDLNLRLNLRTFKYTFPSLKIITLLFMFFCLGYFLSYYRGIKKVFLLKKEIKTLSNQLNEKKSGNGLKAEEAENKAEQAEKIIDASETEKEQDRTPDKAE